ncbi:hypothetical protein B6I21_04690 [candidate division KSB1 bacterium 4572_119]|nr:MAG: hypothetical protein B6I21_04690 [candidate division KSB1 bacterium 4572_119]
MEKFIKFKNKIELSELHKVLRDQRIILLRESQTTETIQVKIIGNLADKEIKQAFTPYHIQKIYNEFPLPLKHNSFNLLSFKPVIAMVKKIF